MARNQRSVRNGRARKQSKKKTRSSRRQGNQRGGATEEDIMNDPVARQLLPHANDMEGLTTELEQLERDVVSGKISKEKGEEEMNRLSVHFMNILSNGESAISNAVESQKPTTTE